MKKFSIVLLALLLAGGFAFAADMVLEGEVVSSFTLDFEDSEYGFGLSETAGFDITWTGSASSEGEGDVYAVITVEDAEALIDETGLTVTNGSASAKVVGPEWVVAFGSSTGFGNATAPDMAQDGDDTASFDDVTPTFEAGNGLTVTYSDITVGFDFYYDNDLNDDGTTGDNDLMYMATTGYALDLADGLTADTEVAIASLSGSASTDLFGTLALAYEMDDLTVDAAMDLALENDFADLGFDASVAADYAMNEMSFYAKAYYGDEDIDLLAKTSYAADGYSVGVWGYLDSILTDGVRTGSDAADGDWAVYLDATYDINDVYDVYAKTGFNEAQTVPLTVGLNAALIDNAAVKVEYVSDDVSAFANNMGALTTSVTVSL
ncbi:MAG: hypothetical protein ACQEQU_09485 [Spirochaetota bacterium]